MVTLAVLLCGQLGLFQKNGAPFEIAHVLQLQLGELFGHYGRPGYASGTGWLGRMREEGRKCIAALDVVCDCGHAHENRRVRPRGSVCLPNQKGLLISVMFVSLGRRRRLWGNDAQQSLMNGIYTHCPPQLCILFLCRGLRKRRSFALCHTCLGSAQ